MVNLNQTRTEKEEAIERMRANLPPDMLKYNNFVCFSLEPDTTSHSGYSKKPKNPKKPKNAKSNDPTTWGSFDEAAGAWIKSSTLHGIGFMFGNSPFFGVDIDDMGDKLNSGDFDGADMVQALHTYTEYSPSGTGLHCICIGELPPKDRKHGKFEMYSDGRFFTMTGKVYANPRTISDCTESIKPYHEKYIVIPKKEAKKKAKEAKKPTQTHRPAAVGTLAEDEIIRKASNAANGSKFKALYFDGDTSAYGGNDSDADMALCNLLAFWTGKNAGTMDTLFRKSALYRPKWDEKRGTETYGEITIKEAIDFCDKCYEGGTPSAPRFIIKAPAADPVPPADQTENAGSNTISTEYAYGLQFKHGIDISANAEDSKGKPQIVLTPFVFEKLCAALEINFRWDDLRHKVVYSGFSKNELQDTLTNTAPTILKEAFTGLKLKQNNTENISECIRVHASRRHFNPVLEMISGVQWDGIDRVQQIYDMWELKDPYSQAFMRKWLYQCYCMLYNGTEGESWSGEFVLVLKGVQGAGKTQFFKHLAITDSFFNEGATFDPKDKDSQLEVFSSWICELGELGSTMKKDMDMVKAAITRAKDSIRPPYARCAEEYPRRTTFCATVNDDKFLIDMTGNRRWAVIGFDDDFKIPFSKIKALDSLQLWAQIRADVETEIMTTAGTADPKTHENIFRFTEEELKEVFRRTRGYLKPPKGFEEVSDIITAFEQHDPHKGFVLKHKRMSITDWQTEAKNVSTCLQKYSSREIGVCLKVLGYERGSERINGQVITGYYLPYWEYQKVGNYT